MTAKKRILSTHGYIYNFDREVYVNRHTKKVFSVEFVEDNSEQKLRHLVGEINGKKGWQFYFNTPPSDAVKQDLENILRS